MREWGGREGGEEKRGREGGRERAYVFMLDAKSDSSRNLKVVSCTVPSVLRALYTDGQRFQYYPLVRGVYMI